MLWQFHFYAVWYISTSWVPQVSKQISVSIFCSRATRIHSPQLLLLQSHAKYKSNDVSSGFMQYIQQMSQGLSLIMQRGAVGNITRKRGTNWNGPFPLHTPSVLELNSFSKSKDTNFSDYPFIETNMCLFLRYF